jgi:hypothetical protein
MIAPIQIRRADVSDKVRTLAALMGTSITDAIGIAVEAQLAVERAKASKGLSLRRAEAKRKLAGIRRLPVTGPLLSDDDLYDPDGLSK